MLAAYKNGTRFEHLIRDARTVLRMLKERKCRVSVILLPPIGRLQPQSQADRMRKAYNEKLHIIAESKMSKTPVSLLQEYFMRQGSMPLYKLIYDQGGTHQNLFRYQVSIGEHTAVGSGSSKKEAKHDAARTLLERLQIPLGTAYHPSKKVVGELGEEFRVDIFNESLTSENEDSFEFTSPASNSIGKLNDALRSKALPQAEFDLTGEEGPPHEKLFTITCTVSKQKESATARTKKIAKHLAAEKMLARLLKTMPDVLNPKPKPLAQDPPVYEHPLTEVATVAYCDLKGAKRPTTNPAMMTGPHLVMAGKHSETLTELTGGMKCLHVGSTAELLKKFEKIMAELDMTYELVRNPFKTQHISIEGRVYMILQIKGTHEDTLIEFGTTENEAKTNVLKKAVEFLKTMTSI